MRETIKFFLNKKGIAIPESEIDLQLLSNPNFPSILAITDLFEHFGVDNLAAELPIKINMIDELPNSFLANIKSENGNDIVFVEKINNILNLTFNSNTKQYSYEEFLLVWTGVVIVIDNNIKNSDKVENEVIIKTLLSISTLSVFYLGYNNNWQLLLLFLLSIIGVIVSYITLKKELGWSTEKIDKFCTNRKKTNCNAVINSNVAFVYKNIKLSDISLIYFIGVSFFLIMNLLFKKNINGIFLLITMTMASLITPYSIYYQYKVVKNWCPLCLIIVGVLLIQLILSFLNYHYFSNTFDYNFFRDSILYIFTLSSVAVTWLHFKPFIISKLKLNHLKIEHIKFKRNLLFFSSSLENSKFIKNTKITEVKEIYFGNKNAALKIVLITNPICHYCKEAHQIIDKIFKKREQDIYLIIRFNITLEQNMKNKGLIISNILLDKFYNNTGEQVRKSLNDIYKNNNNLDLWIKNNQTKSNHFEALKKQKEWCIINGLNFTPAIIINNYLFPKEYKISDLPYFIDELIEKNK